nr:immunoglobulin heavy chain junction region [Macaca mulatta]MOW47003.1 immunoglobulin heavy chain junction region [Macaca mulatta]
CAKFSGDYKRVWDYW